MIEEGCPHCPCEWEEHVVIEELIIPDVEHPIMIFVACPIDPDGPVQPLMTYDPDGPAWIIAKADQLAADFYSRCEPV